MENKYPIYIISKGRADSRLTSISLEKLDLPYHIVIEPQDYDDYAAVIDKKKILTLPFSNLGQGSIPARNWVWEHSIEQGAKRHWILDDNINGWVRMNRNIKRPCDSNSIFRAMEDFVDRYENVKIAGCHYRYFACATQPRPPFTLNTRVYSNLLIDNSLDMRWRGKYNEDTDLCLRALKEGWCTVLFNAFLINKITTMVMKGGNTDNVYIDGDNRYTFAKSLYDQHSDVVKIVEKWGRWHHEVDYRPFKDNKLILKEGLDIPKGVNNYGIVLKDVDKNKIVTDYSEYHEKY